MPGLKGFMHLGPVKFLKCMVSSEALGEEMISQIVNQYADMQRNFPESEPHKILSMLWMAPFVGRGENPNDEMLNTTALSETFQFSCITPPNNARALALYSVYQERPDIIKSHPKLGQEYERLMAPVNAAMEDSRIDNLYQQFNPVLARSAALEASRQEESIEPLTLQCQKCEQSLNVPKGMKLKVSCPKCGHSWIHDGTSNNGNTWLVEERSLAIKDGALIEHIGIETKGGILTPLLNSGSKIPCKYKQVFSTAEDMQIAVSIKLYRGMAETIDEAVFLGQYDFPVHPPAPCGVPQIAVTVGATEEDIWISAVNMREG
jgi:hypothetical protein